MITNFTKKVGLAAAISIVTSTAATAAVFNASASFRTIADVSITENTALSFGTNVNGKAGSTCTIASIITDANADALTGVDDLNSATDISGDGCEGTDDAVAGDYTFTGATGATVTVLMATAIDTDFTFAPAGDYNDQNTGTTNISTAYFADAPFNVVLNGTGTQGTGRLSVGGSLNILNDLVASTSYSIAYDISVVY